jgi:1-phosphatidylinositol-4-phosphate 5-kinase
VFLYFGIIDILQYYNFRKVLERTLKSITAERQAISVAPPSKYGNRFAHFMSKTVFEQTISTEE